MIVIFHLERGMPSKRESSARIDYVPALCTHRPSLLPIERFDELFGGDVLKGNWMPYPKFRKSERLEEGEVVTRFP